MEYVTAAEIVTMAMFAAANGAGLTYEEILGMGADALDLTGIGFC